MNTRIEIRVDGYKAFVYDAGGNTDPIKMRVEPESGIVWIFAYGRKHRFDLVSEKIGLVASQVLYDPA